MARPSSVFCTKTSWQGRGAYLMGNDMVRLLSLTGGGHISDFHFDESTGLPSLNPLWVPPWKTIEPYRYRQVVHASRYGSPVVGKLLSGLTGHNICLDYFGEPSEEEAGYGLSLHGEAPSQKWKKTKLRAGNKQVALTLSTTLPAAGLKFNREIRLRAGESVAYFKETVMNQRPADHLFHWTQHVTFGPPFVSHRDSIVTISATKGKTFPHGYEGHALLESAREFRWPHAPTPTGKTVDLTRPFPRRGFGFVAGILLDQARDVVFIAVLNTRVRLLIGYCFRRCDFPWVTVWQENRAMTDPPWLGRCQAMGLEFGTTPFPTVRREALAMGPLFGTPTLTHVPARGRKTVRYIAFLSHVPLGFGAVSNITLSEKKILVRGRGRKDPLCIAASGLAETGLIT